MIKLVIDSTHVSIRGANSDAMKVIDEVTSYKVEGAWFSTAFRNKTWDGLQHLVTYNNSTGYRCWAGCLPDIVHALESNGVTFELVDVRNVPVASVNLGWTGSIMTQQGLKDFVPRDYQVDAVSTFLTKTLPLGRGILKLPVRSGKTVVAAIVIGTLQVPTLFVTTNDLLLNQTVKLFQSMFTGRVGVCAGGKWDPTDLTVATVQTLHSNVKEPCFKELMERVDLLIADECHHFAKSKVVKLPDGTKPKKPPSSGWKDIVLRCPAYYKLGLSATVYLDMSKACEKSDIWLKACTGDICCEVTTKRMVDEGWLLRPVVEVHRVLGPELQGDWAEDELHRRGIVNYANRNQRIVDLTVKEIADGGLVMMHTGRYEHTDLLAEMLGKAGLIVERLDGRTSKQERKEVMVRFRRGRTRVIVGSIFGEGLDVEEVDVVVVAEGGESRKRTIQRLRNLTPSPGKSYVKVLDFLDEHEAHLAKHARARLKAYRAEQAFDVRVVK